MLAFVRELIRIDLQCSTMTTTSTIRTTQNVATQSDRVSSEIKAAIELCVALFELNTDSTRIEFINKYLHLLISVQIKAISSVLHHANYTIQMIFSISFVFLPFFLSFILFVANFCSYFCCCYVLLSRQWPDKPNRLAQIVAQLCRAHNNKHKQHQ